MASTRSRHARRSPQALRENIYYGANLIKVVAAGTPYAYSTEELRFIVDDARTCAPQYAVPLTAEGRWPSS